MLWSFYDQLSHTLFASKRFKTIYNHNVHNGNLKKKLYTHIHTISILTDRRVIRNSLLNPCKANISFGIGKKGEDKKSACLQNRCLWSLKKLYKSNEEKNTTLRKDSGLFVICDTCSITIFPELDTICTKVYHYCGPSVIFKCVYSHYDHDENSHLSPAITEKTTKTSAKEKKSYIIRSKTVPAN